MDAFLTLTQLKINLTFLKLHFEGNESIKCTKAHASWEKKKKGGKKCFWLPPLNVNILSILAGAAEGKGNLQTT